MSPLSDALIESLRRASFLVERSSSPKDVRAPSGVADPVVLVDPSLADELIPTVACVLEVAPTARAIALVPCIGHNQFLLAIQRGVAGFCDPAAGNDAIIRTIRDVRDIGIAMPRHFVPLLVDQLRHGRGLLLDTVAGSVELTDREWEVLSLLRAGRSTAEIAASMYVAPPTVRSHVASMVHKFDVDDRNELVNFFDDS